MSVSMKFNSETIERTASRRITSRTYYAPELGELEQYIEETFPEGSDSEIGRITRNRFYQKGPTWFCDIAGETEYDDTGLAVSWNGDGDTPQAQRHTLSTVVIAIPLNAVSGYRTIWDHYVWVQVPSDGTFGYTLDYKNRTDDVPFHDAQGRRYAWTESCQEALLPEADADHTWRMLEGPSKPGVRQAEYLTYQITEYGEYSTESAASWAVSEMLNTVRTTPPLGNMGVRGSGTWKLDSASIRYNGQRWEASRVWTCRNWDTDLYPLAN